MIMNGIEQISFEIISNVGTARSCFIKAIQEARLKKFIDAQTLISEGERYFLKGHAAHSQLIQAESRGECTEINLLLIHAEDQLMAAESFKILCKEFLKLYSIVLIENDI